MGTAVQVILPRGKCPPRSEVLLRRCIVGVGVQRVGVNVPILVVAYEGHTSEEHLTLSTVPGELTIDKPCALMPQFSRYVEHPSLIGRGERQHVERVTFLLVREGDGIGDGRIALDRVLDGVSGDALACVPHSAVDDTRTTGVQTEPEQRIVQLGYRVWGTTSKLIAGPLDARQREVSTARVIPDLNTVDAEQPQFPVVDNPGDQVVRRTFCAGEVQRVNRRSVQ